MATTRNMPGGFLAATVKRYGLASFSAALVSVAHLLVQLSALRTMPTREIGLLAFLITLIQLGFGLSNAVVSTPYTILVNRKVDDQDRTVQAIFTVNLLLSIGYGLLCGAIAGFSVSPLSGIGFGVATALLLLRWFGRADAYAHHAPQRAALSDLAYSVALITCIGLGLIFHPSFAGVSLWFLIAGFVGMVPFSGSLVRKTIGTLSPDWLTHYADTWKRQSGWALVGVVTAEATANGHVYLVTLLAGPAAFAPIAVGTLFLRPLNVCITALTQLERPRMARSLSEGDAPSAQRSAWHFLAALGVLWAGTVAFAAILILFFPHLILKPTINPVTVSLAIAFCGLLALVQCFQTPWNVFLQAADRFKSLAMTSVRASILSIAAVGLLLVLLPPVYSMMGVIAGQLLMLFGIWRAVQMWKKTS